MIKFGPRAAIAAQRADRAQVYRGPTVTAYDRAVLAAHAATEALWAEGFGGFGDPPTPRPIDQEGGGRGRT